MRGQGILEKQGQRKRRSSRSSIQSRTNGLYDTYNIVMNKLNAPSSLGYCCAGEVIGVGGNVLDISIGDFVACGGAGATHSEINSVPRNLCKDFKS